MNGKGDRPRNNYSNQFRNNYDEIDWSKKNIENINNKSKTDCKDCIDKIQPQHIVLTQPDYGTTV